MECSFFLLVYNFQAHTIQLGWGSGHPWLSAPALYRPYIANSGDSHIGPRVSSRWFSTGTELPRHPSPSPAVPNDPRLPQRSPAIPSHPQPPPGRKNLSPASLHIPSSLFFFPGSMSANPPNYSTVENVVGSLSSPSPSPVSPCPVARPRPPLSVPSKSLCGLKRNKLYGMNFSELFHMWPYHPGSPIHIRRATLTFSSSILNETSGSVQDQFYKVV